MSLTSAVTIIGNIASDIELKFLDNGNARTNVRVAVDRNWRGNDGEWQRETSFISVTAWGKVAENLARVATKGVRVMVVGRLNQRNYEKDGENRSITEIVAEEIGVSTRSIEDMTRRSLSEDNNTEGSKTQTKAPVKSQSNKSQAPRNRNNEDEEPF